MTWRKQRKPRGPSTISTKSRSHRRVDSRARYATPNPDLLETHISAQYAHTAGELSSNKSQLKTWAGDLAEFKDINKRYTDQLIKVKVRNLQFSATGKLNLPLDVRYGKQRPGEVRKGFGQVSLISGAGTPSFDLACLLSF